MWAPDPYGRFQQRYYDGSAWTAHVVDSGGQQTVDPLGTTVSVPFTLPTAATPVAATSPRAATEGPVAGLHSFLDRLGPDARSRPSVHLSIALAGAGGAAAASGIAVAIVGDGDTNRGRTLAAAGTIVVIAYLIRFGVKTHRELRSAAVGAAAVGIPGLAAAITNVDSGGGTLILAAALLIAAWILPGLQGRPLLLGAGAVAAVFALTTTGSPTTSDDSIFSFGPADVIGGSSWLFVLAAIAFLGMVWWLDAAGFHGVGTSLVVAALLASALAVVKVVENLTSTSGALLLTVAGVAVALVGDHGQRRATTWIGVAIAAIGTISTFASLLEPSSTGDTGTMLVLAGLALVVVPVLVRRARESEDAMKDVPPRRI